MNWIKPILLALLACSLQANANEELFKKAQSAYDDERYAEAVLLYTELLDSGLSNREVHYNLANASFKDSDLPAAVWHYRKAWYSAPRDPDIRANLHFALNAAGAIDPAPGFSERVLSTLSISEWIMAGIAGYVLLTLMLLLALRIKAARRTMLKLGLVPMSLLLLATAGWWYWIQFQQRPEWVVTQTEATTLFGPVEGSTAHYKIPLGALVRQTSADSKGWIEVEYDGKQGWLKTDYISRLSP